MPRRHTLPEVFTSSTGTGRIVELARTGNQTLNGATAHVWSIQPTANLTLSIGNTQAGQRIAILVEQTTLTSRTVTFGTGFKTTGTLATGTAASKMFVMNFISDGTTCWERSRTTAITVS